MSLGSWQIDIDMNTLVFVSLMVAMVTIGLWTALSRSHLDNLVAMGAPVVDNLFLKVGIKSATSGAKARVDGFIRTLGARRATIVVSKLDVAKGDAISIDLSSLPNFPERDAWTNARVKSVQPLDGGSMLVSAVFGEQPTPATMETLANYVVALARSSGRYSHA